MNTSAQRLPAIDPAEYDLEVIIQVRSVKHDCNVAYLVSQIDIENGYVNEIIRDLNYRLMDFIQEKLNASSEGFQSKVEERILN